MSDIQHEVAGSSKQELAAQFAAEERVDRRDHNPSPEGSTEAEESPPRTTIVSPPAGLAAVSTPRASNEGVLTEQRGVPEGIYEELRQEREREAMFDASLKHGKGASLSPEETGTWSLLQRGLKVAETVMNLPGISPSLPKASPADPIGSYLAFRNKRREWRAIALAWSRLRLSR